MKLEDYQLKRDFKKTPEPKGDTAPSRSGRLYVIQKHAARRLHYDLRLEIDGVLKSWAVPKGPSLDPKEKRLAVQVEDHPIAYGGFEGVIPQNEYGAGAVLIWDYGEWESEGDVDKAFRNGNLKFRLYGRKLKGRWVLARMRSQPEAGKTEWLLIKHRDAAAVEGPDGDILEKKPESVLTGRMIEEIATDRDRVWKDGRAVDLAGEGRPPKAAGPKLSPARLPNARKAEQPGSLQPQMAIAVDAPPEGDEWLHEIKYDGYRILCFVRNKQVSLVSRNGKDWTDRFPSIALEAAALPVDQAIFDGEVVMLKGDGISSFQALQNFFKGKRSGTLVYFLFDLPYCQGYDLTAVPLSRRKEFLRNLIRPGKNSVIQFGNEILGQGETVFKQACELGVEGIVSKRIDGPYEQRRSSKWVKSKCRLQQEFVIGGYSLSEAAAGGLRSLLVGYYRPSGELVFAGKVGTGFSNAVRKELMQMLQKLKRSTSPFVDPPREKHLRWAKPDLVAAVEFAEWTNEGLLRQASFLGLREDKGAEELVLETTAGNAGQPPSKPTVSPINLVDSRIQIAGVRLTHPERVLYPELGITKGDLAHYYQKVAERILPHIIHRPLTLVRCPEGHSNECFYQRHFNETLPESIKGVHLREKKEEQNYIYISDLAGLISLVQISALEIHPWGSRIDRPNLADMAIFDLDPDPSLEWERVVNAAWHLKGILQGLGLTSFVKTSGGKGLHVQLPLSRHVEWGAIKKFTREIAEKMASDQPGRYTATASKSSRKGKIYIDYLRNGFAATNVAPYSTRARQGAPLSIPISWNDLSQRIGPSTFTLRNLPVYLEQTKVDPWEGFFQTENVIPF